MLKITNEVAWSVSKPVDECCLSEVATMGRRAMEGQTRTCMCGNHLLAGNERLFDRSWTGKFSDMAPAPATTERTLRVIYFQKRFFPVPDVIRKWDNQRAFSRQAETIDRPVEQLPVDQAVELRDGYIIKISDAPVSSVLRSLDQGVVGVFG